MDNSTVNSLLEALKFSPDNLPLRFHLADTLLKLKRFDEAETQFIELLNQSSATQYKFGLAEVYFLKKEYSKSIVILEDILNHEEHFDTLILFSKILVAEHSLAKAQKTYQRALNLNPGYKDDFLDGQLRMAQEVYDDFEDDDDNEEDDDDCEYCGFSGCDGSCEDEDDEEENYDEDDDEDGDRRHDERNGRKCVAENSEGLLNLSQERRERIGGCLYKRRVGAVEIYELCHERRRIGRISTHCYLLILLLVYWDEAFELVVVQKEAS